MSNLSLPTSHTLIGALISKPNEEDWNRFVARYGPCIYGWCRRRGLQEVDAEDVTQEIFKKLLHGLRSYSRNKGKFRSWLSIVVKNAVADQKKSKERRREECGSEPAWDRLDDEPAREDLLRQFEEEQKREVLQLAEQHVRLTVRESTWLSYELTAKQGKSGKEAAAQLGLSENAIYKNCERVLARLQDEAKRLWEQLEQDPCSALGPPPQAEE